MALFKGSLLVLLYIFSKTMNIKVSTKSGFVLGFVSCRTKIKA